MECSDFASCRIRRILSQSQKQRCVVAKFGAYIQLYEFVLAQRGIQNVYVPSEVDKIKHLLPLINIFKWHIFNNQATLQYKVLISNFTFTTTSLIVFFAIELKIR